MSFPHISEQEAEKVYERLERNLMGELLIRTFKREIKPSTLRQGPGQYYSKNYSGSKLYATTKIFDKVAMVLEQYKEGGILNFYSGDIEELLDRGNSDSVFCNNFASIDAMPRPTGVWEDGKGDQLAYALSISHRKDIILPSQLNHWFIGIMSWLSDISSEYLELPKQPKIWTMDLMDHSKEKD